MHVSEDNETPGRARGALASMVVAGLALGCPASEEAGQKTVEAAEAKGAQEAKKAVAEAEPKGEPPGAKVEVKLGVGDGLKYDRTRIEVAAGSTVVLTIAHGGKLPKSAMGHNFVLLEQGTDMAAFAKAAMQAKDSGYIPKAMEDAVIAHTEVVGGGQSDTIEFAAPEPGEYQFLCSFPGHYSSMNGVFVVK